MPKFRAAVPCGCGVRHFGSFCGTAFARRRPTGQSMIHQYKMNGYNIVIDVFSGSVHLVDSLA
ncbi:MAG: hypothetical protein ACFN2Z_06550 [Oribacterium sp.]